MVENGEMSSFGWSNAEYTVGTMGRIRKILDRRDLLKGKQLGKSISAPQCGKPQREREPTEFFFFLFYFKWKFESFSFQTNSPLCPLYCRLCVQLGNEKVD